MEQHKQAWSEKVGGATQASFSNIHPDYRNSSFLYLCDMNLIMDQGYNQFLLSFTLINHSERLPSGPSC